MKVKTLIPSRVDSSKKIITVFRATATEEMLSSVVSIRIKHVSLLHPGCSLISLRA